MRLGRQRAVDRIEAEYAFAGSADRGAGNRLPAPEACRNSQPMCLIAFAINVHPRYPLVLAGNRDEFHARPSAPADFHRDDPDVYGGRDLRAGGSWLAMHRSGRVVAVTNVRLGLAEAAARSRGALVHEFVRNQSRLEQEIARLGADARAYGRFNLLAYEAGQMHIAGNTPEFFARRVDHGVHAISNAALDTPWPKTRRLQERLAHWIASDDDGIEMLFQALGDEALAPDEDLPDTGVGLALERRLSAAFIRGGEYGTRASTVVLVGQRSLRCIERRFGPEGRTDGSSDIEFPLA